MVRGIGYSRAVQTPNVDIKNIHSTDVPTTSTRVCMIKLPRQASFKCQYSKTLGYWVERLVDAPFVDTGQRMCRRLHLRPCQHGYCLDYQRECKFY